MPDSPGVLVDSSMLSVVDDDWFSDPASIGFSSPLLLSPYDLDGAGLTSGNRSWSPLAAFDEGFFVGLKASGNSSSTTLPVLDEDCVEPCPSPSSAGLLLSWDADSPPDAGDDDEEDPLPLSFGGRSPSLDSLDDDGDGDAAGDGDDEDVEEDEGEGDDDVVSCDDDGDGVGDGDDDGDGVGDGVGFGVGDGVGDVDVDDDSLFEVDTVESCDAFLAVLPESDDERSRTL